MPFVLLFGGSGYIGTQLARSFLEKHYQVYIADTADSPLRDTEGIIFERCDVRKPIPASFIKHPIDWIFHLAAVHREPGHTPEEYFETNIKGAEHVVQFAQKIGCENIFFVSSISVYGPTKSATDEGALTAPNTPYGVSKLAAEYTCKVWQAANPARRLCIVRPGVIYGPADPGNILRMIRAIKKGYFILPVSPKIKKSYGYIYGFCESVFFMLQNSERLCIYNYVEKETEPLGKLIRIVRSTFHYRGVLVRVPLWPLKILAKIIHSIHPNFNGIHPERVQKVARPTHIIPKVLLEKGFQFRYDFQTSLVHWKSIKPDDF